MQLKLQSYGPHSLMVTFGDTIGNESFLRCRQLIQTLEADPLPGLLEWVPSFTTLLLIFDSTCASSRADLELEVYQRFERSGKVLEEPLAPPKEIPIIYNGEDLPALAEAKGMSVAEICRLHAEPVYKVYMLGFSPGFPYLGDLPESLHTARRAEPRPRIRAGSVGIGGPHTGIYSVDSPGGWNIIGTTPARIFDPRREAISQQPESCFMLKPGDRVQFVARTG